MRKDIEILAIWYIPVVILMAGISAYYSDFFNELFLEGSSRVGVTLHFYALLPMAVKTADNLVVAVWLFFMVKKEEGRPLLWAILGLVTHLYAALLYVGLRIYERSALNDSLDPGRRENGAS